MIFYLSGTGNTRWLAERLSALTGERMVNIITELSDPHPFRLESGESVGFCFPIHAWRPPMLMRRFISQMELVYPPDGEVPYCWSVFTLGDTAGQAVKYLQRDLDRNASGREVGQKTLPLRLVASVAMPNTYVGLPLMDVDTPEVAKGKLEAAEAMVKDLAQRIVNRDQGRFVSKGKRAWFNSAVVGAGFTKWISDEAFHVKDNCILCGRCAQVCPVFDIRFLMGSKPQWNHNGLCMNCFSCYHHCPVHAIEFGKRTLSKGQYYFGKEL